MTELKIYGKDFTELSKATWKVMGDSPGQTEQIEFGDGKMLDLNANSKANLVKLIKDFLDDSAVKEALGNTAKGPAERNIDLYTYFKEGLRFEGYVGVLSGPLEIILSDYGCKDEDGNPDPTREKLKIVLQITSRFDIGDDRPFFLATMLQGEANPELSGQTVPSSHEELFDFLLLIRFRNCLKEAYELKGYFRTYQTFHNNNDRPRGSIDIARHIKENMGLSNGRIAYNYKEKSVDNYLNHLIVAAYRYFKRIYPDWTNEYIDSAGAYVKGILDNLGYEIHFPQYDNRTLIMKNLSILAHPYYTEYEALRKISLMMLRNESISFFDGTEEYTESILFYLPDLFENFVARTLDIKYSQVPKHVFSYDTGTYKQKIIPDYVFYEEDDNSRPAYMILDAKFKPGWGNTVKEKRPLGSLLMPDYDKCIRDMNAFNCHATGVIFPVKEADFKENDYCKPHNISELNNIDHFHTIPICVPTKKVAESYQDWSKRLYEQCKEVREKLDNIKDCEKAYNIKVKECMTNMALWREESSE